MSSKIFRLVFNFISSLKSVNDKVTILNAIKSAAENQIQGCKSHFIFAGDIFWTEIRLRPVMIEGMKKYNINSAMVSILSSERKCVTTNEEVEDHRKGKYEDKNSIHDDLDSFFERLCLGEEPNEKTRTYFFPKLSEKEMELFQAQDRDFINTLYDYSSADPYPAESFPILISNTLDRFGNGNEIELAHSWTELYKTTTENLESKPEYLKCECSKQTFTMTRTTIKRLRDRQRFRQSETKIRKMN